MVEMHQCDFCHILMAMLVRSLLLLHTIVLLTFCAQAQTRDWSSVAQHLVEMQGKLSPWDDDYDWKDAGRYRDSLEHYLNIPESFDYPFSELRPGDGPHIFIMSNVINAPDGRVRIFTWNNGQGGTWHSISNLVQIKLPKGQVSVTGILDRGEDDAIADILYEQLDTLTIKGKRHYLSYGYLKHGSRDAFYVAELFTIEKGQLVSAPLFRYDHRSRDFLVLGLGSGITYDHKTKTFHCPVVDPAPLYDDGARAPDRSLKLRWNGSTFHE